MSKNCFEYSLALSLLLAIFFVAICNNGMAQSSASAPVVTTQLPASSLPRAVSATPKNAQKKTNDIIFQLDKAGIFEIFLQALEKSGWQEKLLKAENYTVFAPSDAAFVHVDSTSKELIFSEKNNLKNFVEQHIAVNLYSLKDLETMQTVPTVSGLDLIIEKKQPITIAQAPLLRSDIKTDNGIIHVLGVAKLVEK